mmetsp:Transcript_32700/g.105634  ORF Transcript_32700/g.105634 Transcript_32700/m.105634 type:complete len:329 (+) Transcript_32700:112-1098(+)
MQVRGLAGGQRRRRPAICMDTTHTHAMCHVHTHVTFYVSQLRSSLWQRGAAGWRCHASPSVQPCSMPQQRPHPHGQEAGGRVDSIPAYTGPVPTRDADDVDGNLKLGDIAGHCEAHRSLSLAERSAGHLVGRSCALAQDLGQVLGLSRQLVVPLLHRLQVRNNCVGQQRLEGAPPNPLGCLGRHLLLGPSGHRLVDGQQVVGLGSVRVVAHALDRIGLTPLDLAADLVGGVEQVDPRGIVLVRLAHLGRAVLQAHHASVGLDDERFGLREDLTRLLLAVLVVEPARNVARQLQVLPLVLADRDELSLVQQNVRSHQHRVVEEADRHTL